MRFKMEIKTTEEIKKYGVDYGLLNYNPKKKWVAVDDILIQLETINREVVLTNHARLMLSGMINMLKVKKNE